MCNISKQQQKKLNIENIKDLTQCPISLKLFHILCFIYFFIYCDIIQNVLLDYY